MFPCIFAFHDFCFSLFLLILATFVYMMHCLAGSLRIKLKDHEGAERLLFDKSGDQGNLWHSVNIPTYVKEAYQV